MKTLAPIALFVYNRPEHTQKTLEALKANQLASKSPLIVFSDGAKNEGALHQVEKVRQYLETINGFASVKIVKHKKNLGLANSIISGVSEIVDQYGKIIVLEDDLLTSPYFLDYMNEGLDLYVDTPEVASVNAYMYPIEGLPDTFFLRSSDCWGWGTWKRAWKMFESDGSVLLKKIIDKNLVSVFNFGGYYPYLKMLQQQVTGENDSWAIRWAASTLVNDKLGLYPGKSFTRNIGLDGTGRHCGEVNDERYGAAVVSVSVKLKYLEPVFDNKLSIVIGQYMAKHFLPSFFHKVFARIKTIIPFLKSSKKFQ